MLEKIIGLKKMSLLQCQEAAKKFDYDGCTFDLVGPKGRTKAKWLDAYLGLFQVEGSEGFIMVSDFQFNDDLYCENLNISNDSV